MNEFNEEDYVDRNQENEEKDVDGILKQSISPTELKIIKLLARGYSSKEMYAETHYKSTSIDQYKSRLINRLNLRNDKHLVAWAFANGLIGADDLFG